MKNFLFLVFVSVVIIGIYFLLSCKNQGGSWEFVGFQPHPMCIHHYSDGGQTCKSSADCLGDCIVQQIDGSNLVCAFDNNPFGCKASVEDFLEYGGIICID